MFNYASWNCKSLIHDFHRTLGVEAECIFNRLGFDISTAFSHKNQIVFNRKLKRVRLGPVGE